MAAVLTTAALVGGGATIAAADGTETLGAPSIAVASGSGVVAAGVGLGAAQPAAIDLVVPAGASVEQVLLYWEGHHSNPANGDGTVNLGGTDVTGVAIGGPTLFFGTNYSSTYRADVTALGLISAGANSVAIGGMDFDRANNGAGLMVVYADGTTADIGLRDGNDLAYWNFAAPLDTTVAQTFTFAAEPVDRVADLAMFFSSVADDPGIDRPTTIEIEVGGLSTPLLNVLDSVDGPEWDTVSVPVAIPAGATSLTVQARSADGLATGANPASFAWSAAALSVPTTPPPPPGGGEGCTPGYWKQPHHLDSWVGYAPADSYSATFGIAPSFGDVTLLEALALKGGGDKALARHAVAALLNSATAHVSYDLDTAGVVAAVQAAYSTGSIEPTKNRLADLNEQGCPLN
ncbi:MAG: hypothetical protein OEY23_10500 [Acidimicrobiia bacterium]|nr:hypothetical protein [Acidimicrobiia bacterium]